MATSAAALLVSLSAQAAVNTPDTFTTSTSLLTAGNWSAGLPDNTKDALFSSSSPAGPFTITSGNLTVGSLSDAKAFATVTITNGATAGGSTSTLTLGGAGGTNSTSGALSTDLIYVAGGASTILNLNGGASFGLNLVLGQAGSFNVGGSSVLNIGTTGTASTLNNGGFALTVTGAGATNIGSVISNGALTKSGTGTLTLSGANSYTGTTAINGGTLTLTGSINSNSALTLGGGTLNYTPTTAGTTQTFNNTTINSGGSTVTNATATNVVALGTLTRTAGGVLNVSSLVGTTTTSTTNDGTGFLGDWATTGSGTSLTYAKNNGSGTIVAYAGTSAATAANVTDTTGAVNYDVAAVGTLGAGASFNTLRYTGAAGTITNNFTANGLMNAGTGTVTYSGNVTIGANKELVIVGNTQGTTISGNIVDNGGGASSLVYGGPSAGTLVLSGANNTYSGGTIINSGIVDLRNSNSVGTGGINLAGAGGTLAVNTAVTVTVSANITGQGKVSTGNSAAVLTLAGNNDFTGGVTVNGTVVMGTGSNNGLGTGTLTLSQSTLRSSDNNSRTIANAISMSSNAMTFGAIQGAVTGLGDLNFTYTGATVSVGGAKTWTVNNSTTATFANNWNGNAGFNVTKAGTGTLVFNGNLSHGASNVLVSAGTLALNGGAGTYSGTTTISGGTLSVGANAPSGSAGALGNATSAVTLGDAATTSGNLSASLLTGGAFTIGRAVTIANQATSGTYTIGGNTDNNSTFSGLITANQSFNIAQVATTSTNKLSLTGGITAGNAGAKTVTFNNTGAVSVSGTAISDGSGTLAVSQTGAGTTTLSVANSYSGGTTVSAGTLALSGGGTFGSGSLTVSGGTANLGGASITNTLGALTGGGAVNNGTITNNSGTYDVQNGTVGAVLAGSNGLTKSNASTVTLNSANTYSGNTLISGGTLALGSSGSIASAIIQNNATFNVSAVTGGFSVGSGQTLKGTGSVTGATTIASGGTLAPGNSPGVMTFNDALTLAGTTAMEANGTVRGTSYDGINTGTGLLTYGGTMTVTFGSTFLTGGESFDLFSIGAGGSSGSFSSVSIAGSYIASLTNTAGVWTGSNGVYDFTFTQSTGDLLVAVTAVPEPSTYAAIFGALALAGVVCRRRRTRA